ncbi:efflux RND transporter periplasmic adaptor subunit [uncultured Thiodictyon sp.]|jgi:membrane fusion protein (multidrug efflux system)|uniref:efflux RND transporter periplasmic adaptor subunit n=1 Tax=uncultured Thiodictyon sp. TaxID=1846217 RepID=UPI0025D7CD91|nr:efflux RND transporter periplasmic adaptor subunit [uncultured Thiodictyon sp.]
MPHRPLLPGSRRYRLPVLALACAAILGLPQGCGSDTMPAAPAAAPPAVVVVAAKQAAVEEQVQFIGRVVAVDRVDLQARVQGFLKERKFSEGQDVKVGELLFVIEPEQYQAVVTQREADLTKAVADEQNARAQLARGMELVKQKNIAQSEVDKLQAAQSIAKAGIAQAQAALDAAKLDLNYTRIIAPVAGRIGLSKYSVGTLVGPASGTLATIVSSNPIDVKFPVTQRELLQARRDIEAGGGDPSKVVVLARLSDDSLYEHQGKLNFIDVTTDRGTDSVTLRAVFPNPKGILVDGQYVGVLVQDDTPTLAILVPQSALQLDQQGTFVLIVAADQKAQLRRIQTGPSVGADVVVRAGLSAGELVITEGLQKVRPGILVTAAPAQSATQAPAGLVAP